MARAFRSARWLSSQCPGTPIAESVANSEPDGGGEGVQGGGESEAGIPWGGSEMGIRQSGVVMVGRAVPPIESAISQAIFPLEGLTQGESNCI
jgi:hypothetical protein